jgi:hypothetical protein
MSRDAGLGDPQDAGQFRDVQALEREEPEEPEPDLVPEQPIERRGLLHIYKSTLIDTVLARPGSLLTHL